MASLAPGSWLGLLGGGQLGRMFVHAAQRLGYKVLVLEPEADCPAAQAADAAIDAEYTDAAALSEIARRCAAATIEFENVPAAALESLALHIPVYPSAAAVAVAQNRSAEKRLFAACNVPVAPHRLIERATDIERIGASLLPGILKTCTLGYDGLGQRRVGTVEAAHIAWHELGEVACVLEKQLPLAKEVSVIVARAKDGSATAFPIAENQHRAGILALTILPARIDPELAQRARLSALAIARALDYVGVLCVEFFVLSDGSLVANEMAPRPHNSGHATIEACTTSQFEQQVRVAAGLPLGDVMLLSPAVMVNVLGDIWDKGAAMQEPDWAAVAALPGTKLHLYGKRAARRGRKMGHVTCLAATHAQALERANRVALCLGIEPFV
jgi:5-(carboxyamino)imidazole ribonucleotide synthase